MKGIALSIETIVIVIVAVLVLLVIVIFFTGGFTPNEQGIVLRSNQNRYCSQYVNIAGDCEKTNYALYDECNENVNCLLREIADVGYKLGYSSCISNTRASLSCIRECCRNFCETEGNDCVIDGKGKCFDAGPECSEIQENVNGEVITYKDPLDDYVCRADQQCCIPSS